MAALVQSYPQSSSTVTMLQTRPGSSSGHYQGQGQQRGSQMPRNMYNASNGQYRGQPAVAPVAPYAFTATPALTASNPLRQNPVSQPRLENRSASAPATQTQSTDGHAKSSTNPPQLSNDDFPGLGSKANTEIDRPLSTIDLSLTDPRVAPGNAVKPSPDRYRRNHKRSETSQPALGSQPTGSMYQQPTHTASSPSFTSLDPRSSGSKDDSSIGRSSEQAKRYRRRSINTIGGDDNVVQPRAQQPPATRSYASVVSGVHSQPDVRPPHPVGLRPASSHGRQGSQESVSTSRSTSRPSSRREAGSVGAGNPTGANGLPISKPTSDNKPISVPPRGSSDANKRINQPSPLSRPMAVGSDSSVSKNQFAALVASKNQNGETATAKLPESPAAQQLAALSQKEAKKDGKQSRLRRAFSFGSAAELRKASAENIQQSNERAKLKKDQFRDEEEARQAAIVRQQEASGLGEGIYSGQGNFFLGSTDNLSVSSTASSASVMLRKMGKGMKKSTRSLVGLFRPKSVIGVPAADAALPEPTVAQVSMVTVEAEREKVNVNLDPHDQVGGGTGFPKLERNSLDAGSLGQGEPSLTSDKSSESGRPRPSIVGGERERAEVLATIKKGILKRNGTDSANSSPRTRPTDLKSSDFTLPHIPKITDSPHSSQPSTPVDETTPRGHRRTDSITIEGEDYFAGSNKFASDRVPGTPRSIAARNISFSPRIQFHDTWTSTDYDRRGDIATCNRLTPSLAQAIKEELNTFKMEMEVHETSKVYTHFF